MDKLRQSGNSIEGMWSRSRSGTGYLNGHKTAYSLFTLHYMKEGISGAGKFYEIFRLLQAYARCPILSVCILADVIYYYYPLYHRNTQYLTGRLRFMDI